MGVDPSGLAHIEYRVNNEDWKNYAPFTLQTQKPGNYLIKYRAIDNVGNVEVEQTMRVVVKKALAIEVYDKTALRRTSVWLNLNEEQLNKVNRQALEDLLNRDSYIYNIADSRDAFIKDIQSNSYTSYLILGNQHNFTGQIGAQLREQIYAGKTVVSSLFSNVDEVTMPQISSEFDEIFAVKNVGSFPGKSHTLTFDQTLEIKGRALKLEPAQSAFIYGRLNDTLYPAIIQNNFVLGKTYLLAFDAFENLHDSQVTSYLENLLYQASPSIQNLPYSPKVFEVKIRANVVPITAYFDINGSNALPLNPESYPYYFNAQTETQSIKLLVRYSDNEQAIFKVNSGYLVRGEPIASQTFSYVEKLEETSRSLISKLLTELDALIENDSNPKLLKAKEYLKQLRDPSLENKETVVHELLKVIKDAVSYKQLREYLAKLTIIYGSFY